MWYPISSCPTRTATHGGSPTELANGPIVLFFYPKALTGGCTKESCHFRDLAAEFAAVGAQRFGISADPVERQKKFSDKHLPSTSRCCRIPTASSPSSSASSDPGRS